MTHYLNKKEAELGEKLLKNGFIFQHEKIICAFKDILGR